MHFTELDLDPDLLRGIADKGFTTLTPVQEQTLTVTLRGGDAAVQSQTGTGKTAAFLITIFQHMREAGAAGRKKALVICPTRELAVQIEGEAKLLNRHLGLSVGCFYGGVGYAVQLNLLKNGVPETLTGDAVAVGRSILVLDTEGRQVNVILPNKWVVGCRRSANSWGSTSGGADSVDRRVQPFTPRQAARPHGRPYIRPHRRDVVYTRAQAGAEQITAPPSLLRERRQGQTLSG